MGRDHLNLLGTHAGGQRGESIQGGRAARGRNLEIRTRSVVASAEVGSAVEVAVSSLDKAGIGVDSVGAGRLGAEAIQRRPRARGSDFENRANAVVVRTAGFGCAIEVSVRGLDQASNGQGAVRAIVGLGEAE